MRHSTSGLQDGVDCRERPPARLRISDLSYVGSAGLRGRLSRTLLSALGVAIGIAAMIGVVGVSASSQHRLNEQLAELGTNLLTVGASDALPGAVPLPADARTRLEHTPGITSAAQITQLDAVGVYRNAYIPAGQTAGITLTATSLNLPDVLAATMKDGRWLTAATENLPTVVLGSTAADRLAVYRPGTLIWIKGAQAVVLGILNPITLAPELDAAAFIGIPAAADFGSTDHPSRLFSRTADDAVGEIRDLLPSAVQPESPGSVAVSRPSGALSAAAAAHSAFTGLLLAVGLIALIVGGVGVANTMVVTVLERRREIGLRRALGATRAHIRSQFVAESLLLSLIGGAGGIVAGVAVTTVVALLNNWTVVVPPLALAGGLTATVVVGVTAGIYPATRAAKMTPTTSLTA